jgi:hypothetical protein
MRAASVMRFVVLGAAGFGIGGAISRPLSLLLPGTVALPLTLLVGGAVGGAALGLALKEGRRGVTLAVLGALGLFVGVFAGLILVGVSARFTPSAFFVNYSEVPIAAIVGAVVGASLGVTFLDWRVILALAVAGAVGFGVGLLTGDLLRASFPLFRGVGEVGSITVAGLVGGASLGAALGYLESRKLAEQRRSRVR